MIAQIPVQTMVIFPHCKINLGLNIICKRADGYHDIETVFYPVQIHDALEIIGENQTIQNDDIFFSASGIPVSTAADNLCVKAWEILKNDFPQLPSLKMHLYKAIPLESGLAGGSSDGAFTLLLLNKKFQLNLSEEKLIAYALKLGSDCPFFIINKPCFAEGRGELMQTIGMDLSSYKLLIVNPGIRINTRWAFSQIQPAAPLKRITDIIAQPLETWKEELVNDFEKPIMKFYPELNNIKELLYTNGASYASMSGSGSTFFGIFPQSMKNISDLFPKSYFVKEVIHEPLIRINIS